MWEFRFGEIPLASDPSCRPVTKRGEGRAISANKAQTAACSCFFLKAKQITQRTPGLITPYCSIALRVLRMLHLRSFLSFLVFGTPSKIRCISLFSSNMTGLRKLDSNGASRIDNAECRTDRCFGPLMLFRTWYIINAMSAPRMAAQDAAQY